MTQFSFLTESQIKVKKLNFKINKLNCFLHCHSYHKFDTYYIEYQDIVTMYLAYFQPDSKSKTG